MQKEPADTPEDPRRFRERCYLGLANRLNGCGGWI